MEYPHECFTRTGGKAIVYADNGGDERPFIGAYWTGDEWIPCSWLSTGRFTANHFSALDLLLYFDPVNGYST